MNFSWFGALAGSFEPAERLRRSINRDTCASSLCWTLMNDTFDMINGRDMSSCRLNFSSFEVARKFRGIVRRPSFAVILHGDPSGLVPKESLKNGNRRQQFNSGSHWHGRASSLYLFSRSYWWYLHAFVWFYLCKGNLLVRTHSWPRTGPLFTHLLSPQPDVSSPAVSFSFHPQSPSKIVLVAELESSSFDPYFSPAERSSGRKAQGVAWISTGTAIDCAWRRL
jgi:hypothetical protein